MAMVEYMDKPGTLVELGCGNGRDALFFSEKLNLDVLALDQCESQILRLQKNYPRDNLMFVATDFSTYHPTTPIHYVYSRWTMHAITKDAEDRTLAWVQKALVEGGKLFIEARSIRDDLYGVGQSVGKHAFISDHYRRFMDVQAMVDKLKKQGYMIRYSLESRGLAVHQGDDPVIVRIVAERRR